MTTGEALWKYLANAGVEYIFGIVGRESEFLDLTSDRPRFILFHNEMCTGIAAEVFGRVTGRAQACFSTMGPGVTNLSTGVASAFLDRSPLLALSAQVETTELHPGTHQYLDNVAVMKPITKGAWEVSRGTELFETLDEAFKLMMEPRKGPCFVSIPTDLFGKEFDEVHRPSESTLKPSMTNWEHLGDFVKILEESSQPLIICGNAALYGDTPQWVERWAVEMNIPVASSLAGKGVIDERHPLALGCLTKYIEEFFEYSLGDEVFSKVDTVVLVGYDHGEDLTPKLWKDHFPSHVLRINNIDDGLGALFPASHSLIDPCMERPIKAILDRVQTKKQLRIDVEKLRNRRNERASELSPKGSLHLSPFRAVRVVQSCLPEGSLISVDVGLHKHVCGQVFEVREPMTYVGSNGLATMGFGLPAAIGLKLAHPSRPVVTFCGDGGFHAVSAELETCKREKIPLIVVVLKDNAYGLIRRYHYKGFKSYEDVSTKFSNTEFALLAQSYGCNGYAVSDEESLVRALTESFKSETPTLIEVAVDYRLK